MKCVRPCELLTATVALLTVVTSVSASRLDISDDYNSILVEDPLQPLWDSLDDLAAQITNDIKTEMKTKMNALSRTISTQTTAIQNSIRSGLRQGGTTRSVFGIARPFDSASSLQGLEDRIITSNDEGVTKIEGHVNVKIDGLQNRLIEELNRRLPAVSLPNATSSSGSIGVEGVGVGGALLVLLENLSAKVDAIGRKQDSIMVEVMKIKEDMMVGGGGGGGGSPGACGTLVDKVAELLNRPEGASVVDGGSCGLTNQSVGILTTALNRLQASPSFLPRDCSDQHWQHPEYPDGVVETFPTLDVKNPVYAYCVMKQGELKSTGGWTVILRRRNSTAGHIDFNRTWTDYEQGFGEPGDGEWWYGLAPLHALTYRQPYEVIIKMHDIEDGDFVANYNTFRVEDEANMYRLLLGGFNGTRDLSDAFATTHHGSPFSTYDNDNDKWEDGSCAVSNNGGWWFSRCHHVTLTAPFPDSTDRKARVIRWKNTDKWLVLDDVTLMIRPTNYADRYLNE